MDIRVDVSDPFMGLDDPWLHRVTVTAAFKGRCVAKCDARLIKEDRYTSATQHFFSASDNESDRMSDLVHLMLWSEDRWGGVGNTKLLPSEKRVMRWYLDGQTREEQNTIQSRIPVYVGPVLFKPRPGTADGYKIPQKITWALLFTSIRVEKPYRRRGIARAMVRKALERTRSLAAAERPGRRLLAAVEPGYL